MNEIITCMQKRGLIDAITSDELLQFLALPRRVYCGFDPTGDSLHLGNLVALIGLAWFQRAGHTPVVLIGGATGMIGDPSGKVHERQLLDEATIATNIAGIRKNIEAVLNFDVPNAPMIFNNYDWLQEFSFIGFLRDIGKHFRMGTMLAKESVRSRLASEEGMSYTEFSYQLLQGYDFLHLAREHQVMLQLGGSDQWGNITAGVDLVRRVAGEQVFGATFPLLLKSDGSKFGKTEKGAVWLSPEKLSPYEFYQYLVRVSDDDVIHLMQMLTFVEIKEIEEYARALKIGELRPNTVQRRLAEEVTRIVHGQEALEVALATTTAAAPGSTTELNADMLEAAAGGMPNVKRPKSEIVGIKVIELTVAVGLRKSKGEVRRLIQSGGLYLNNARVTDVSGVVTDADLIGDKMLLLAAGMKNKVLIQVDEQE